MNSFSGRVEQKSRAKCVELNEEPQTASKEWDSRFAAAFPRSRIILSQIIDERLKRKARKPIGIIMVKLVPGYGRY